MSAERSPRAVRSQPTALERAKRAWRGEAALIRNELREQGVQGPLPRLDAQSAGRRGINAAQQAFRDAQEFRAAGVPEGDALRRLLRRYSQAIEMAYQPPQSA